MKIDKRLKIVIAAVILAACAFGGYTYYQSQQTAKQAKAIETADVVRKAYARQSRRRVPSVLSIPSKSHRKSRPASARSWSKK